MQHHALTTVAANRNRRRKSQKRGCQAAGGAGALATVCLLLEALAGCGRAPEVHERVIPVFGTIVQVQIVGAQADVAERALDRLEALYRELDVEWRAFGPGDLGRVNAQLAAGAPAELSPRLHHLLETALEARERSGGLFDPRVGPLVALWGFDDLANHDPPSRPPSEDAVAAARVAAIERAGLHLEGNRLWSDAPVTLDLAGVAKGSALVAGARLLRAQGIGDALIVAGGDVIALGSHGGRPWRIGVRDPLGTGVLGTLDLEPGEAALSSGDYERSYPVPGGKAHHIIDPRTGWPARGSAGATVVSRDAELGNAAATALMVGGTGLFAELTRQFGIDCALLVGSDGALLTTPCMEQRLQRR